jgi:hypothetical protein
MRRLLAGLMAAVLLSVGAARAAEVNPLLPKESEQVMNFNFKQVLESDIIKKYAKTQIEQMLKGEQVKQYTDAFGLDPLKDIDRLTVGMWGKGEDTTAVGILTGKFDPKKLFDAAKAESDKSPDKVKIVDIKNDGKEFKAVKVSNDNGKPMLISVADDKTLIGSTDEKQLAAALTAFNNKDKAKLNKKLSDLVLKQDEKASMFYCAVVEGMLKAEDMPDLSQLSAVGIDGESMKKSLLKMNTMSMTLRLGEEAALDMTMGMKDADSADEMTTNLDKLIDAAKTFLPLAGAQAPQAKDIIGDLTSSLKAKSKDSDVTFGFKIKAKSIAAASGKGDD